MGSEVRMMFSTHIIILFSVLPWHIVYGVKLTAVNDSYYVGQLYLQLRNLERLPAMLPGSDPITTTTSRSILCQRILGSDYFSSQGIESINYFEPVRDAQESANLLNAHIQAIQIGERQVGSFRNAQFPYLMGNLKFEGYIENMYVTAAPFKEHVLVCLGRRRQTKELLPYYISKSYNLTSSFNALTRYKPGRFIFKPDTEGLPRIALAEEPAQVYVSPDYNVELHYIRTRHYNRPVQNQTSDPLCALITSGVLFSQHERLCVAVLGSSYFESRDRYPRKPGFNTTCFLKEVAFQTEYAKRVAVRNYHEWMILCHAATTENVYYISRAYSSNRVFVYRANPSDGKVYLENLSRNITLEDAGNYRVGNEHR